MPIHSLYTIVKLFSLYRTKVDLTKYIEEHHFTFDNVFDC